VDNHVRRRWKSPQSAGKTAQFQPVEEIRGSAQTRSEPLIPSEALGILRPTPTCVAAKDTQMSHRTIRPTDPTPPPRRRRAPRPLAPLTALPEHRSAEAMDDERAAQELIDDLLALVDAGLVAPLADEGTVRYAPADPDDPAA
jgi:hypothetical protein